MPSGWKKNALLIDPYSEMTQKEYNKKRKELRRWKCHTDWKKNKKAMKKLENSSYNILYMSIQNNDYEINIPISKGRFPPMVDYQIWRYEKYEIDPQKLPISETLKEIKKRNTMARENYIRKRKIIYEMMETNNYYSDSIYNISFPMNFHTLGIIKRRQCIDDMLEEHRQNGYEVLSPVLNTKEQVPDKNDFPELKKELEMARFYIDKYCSIGKKQHQKYDSQTVKYGYAGWDQQSSGTRSYRIAMKYQKRRQRRPTKNEIKTQIREDIFDISIGDNNIYKTSCKKLVKPPDQVQAVICQICYNIRSYNNVRSINCGQLKSKYNKKIVGLYRDEVKMKRIQKNVKEKENKIPLICTDCISKIKTIKNICPFCRSHKL